MSTPGRFCTFCRRGEDETRLVAAADGYICRDCARAAVDERDGFAVLSDDGSASHRCLFCGASVADIRRPRPISLRTILDVAARVIAGTLERNALIAKESSAVCRHCLALTRRILP